MHRTQIYLSDDEVDLLDRAVESTGASRSELIRRAIRRQYGEATAGDRRAQLRATAGAWKGWTIAGEDYVEGLRGDLNERLAEHDRS